MCNGLHLQRVLLCMVRGEDIVEDHDRAVSISRREDEGLTIRRPMRKRRRVSSLDPKLEERA